LLYGLQIASSNLAQGADFKQDKSATVCGSYESFEQDYELAEDDCDLKVAEEEGEESVSPTGLETTIDDASEMVAAEERRVRKDAMSQRLMIRIAPQSDWLKFPKEPKTVVA
jgi:hypothetical protein